MCVREGGGGKNWCSSVTPRQNCEARSYRSYHALSSSETMSGLLLLVRRVPSPGICRSKMRVRFSAHSGHCTYAQLLRCTLPSSQCCTPKSCVITWKALLPMERALFNLCVECRPSPSNQNTLSGDETTLRVVCSITRCLPGGILSPGGTMWCHNTGILFPSQI